MDKSMMNQFVKKIAYQYQCDINFSNKCLILQSIKYNFYFYIHLDKMTNNVYKNLFSIENISCIYEKTIDMLDVVVSDLNFENDKTEHLVLTIIGAYNSRIKFTINNTMYLSTEIFEICMGTPIFEDINTLDKLNSILDYIEEVDMILCQLNKHAKGELKILHIERINEYGKNI